MVVSIWPYTTSLHFFCEIVFILAPCRVAPQPRFGSPCSIPWWWWRASARRACATSRTIARSSWEACRQTTPARRSTWNWRRSRGLVGSETLRVNSYMGDYVSKVYFHGMRLGLSLHLPFGWFQAGKMEHFHRRTLGPPGWSLGFFGSVVLGAASWQIWLIFWWPVALAFT